MLTPIRLFRGPRKAQSWLYRKRTTTQEKRKEMKNSAASLANFNVAAKFSAAIVSTVIGFTALIGGQVVSTAAGTTWDSAS
ncbi:hypothetical protein AB0J28_26870, partial [Streptosporangium canum]